MAYVPLVSSPGAEVGAWVGQGWGEREGWGGGQWLGGPC